MEYSNKFIELSNFAAELVATEKMKKDRFIEKLRPNIRKDVCMHEPRRTISCGQWAHVVTQTVQKISLN